MAEDGIEEERRLMYVGVTRARRNLTLTCTAQRNKYGRRIDSMPSRDLFELQGEWPPKGWRPHGQAAETVEPTRASAPKPSKRKSKRTVSDSKPLRRS